MEKAATSTAAREIKTNSDRVVIEGKDVVQPVQRIRKRVVLP